MFNDLLFRLRSLFRRDAVESEADAELRFHFDQQVEKYVKSGRTRQEAMRRARLEFGGHEQLKEEIRDARGVNFIETMFQDIRCGLRILGRTPFYRCRVAAGARRARCMLHSGAPRYSRRSHRRLALRITADTKKRAGTLHYEQFLRALRVRSNAATLTPGRRATLRRCRRRSTRRFFPLRWLRHRLLPASCRSALRCHVRLARRRAALALARAYGFAFA